VNTILSNIPAENSSAIPAGFNQYICTTGQAHFVGWPWTLATQNKRLTKEVHSFLTAHTSRFPSKTNQDPLLGGDT